MGAEGEQQWVYEYGRPRFRAHEPRHYLGKREAKCTNSFP